jgi:hypothetical protein
MKNKISGNSYNFVKALVINEEKKRELLSERFIRIGISKIYLEDFVKPPTQCRKCKAFGHIEKNCKSTQKCGKCNGNHGEDECKVNKDNYKCANCERGHSSFYRGCHGFREAKNLLLLKNNKQNNIRNIDNNSREPVRVTNINSKINTERVYSSFLTSNNNDDLLKKFETILAANKDQLIKQTSDVIKQESIAIQKRIVNILNINNLKLCYFVVDTIKTLVPNVKFTAPKMKIIQEAFSNYQLGEIQLDNLKNHFCSTDNNLLNKNESDPSVNDEYCPGNKYKQ